MLSDWIFGYYFLGRLLVGVKFCFYYLKYRCCLGVEGLVIVMMIKDMCFFGEIIKMFKYWLWRWLFLCDKGKKDFNYWLLLGKFYGIKIICL